MTRPSPLRRANIYSVLKHCNKNKCEKPNCRNSKKQTTSGCTKLTTIPQLVFFVTCNSNSTGLTGLTNYSHGSTTVEGPQLSLLEAGRIVKKAKTYVHGDPSARFDRLHLSFHIHFIASDQNIMILTLSEYNQRI